MENEPLNSDEPVSKWQRARAELKDAVSKTGDVGLDDNIVDALVGLKLLGFLTTASCGGHLERDKHSFPMIQGILEDEAENNLQEKKVESFLAEFNASRPQTDYRLYLLNIGQPGWRIESVAAVKGEAIWDRYHNAMTEERYSEIAELTQRAQAEFAAFTEFLKGKCA